MPSKYDEQTESKAVGLVTDQAQDYAELERTIEILKAATSLFARQSDPRSR